ncbi:MAG: glycerol-3-phosphate dehydrogenase/oxidase [Myxococcota bacterium]
MTGEGSQTTAEGSGRARAERRLVPGSRDADVDVIVIGGGVNGTGVARDACMRGLRVALFERNDIAFGASGNSSGMIHGGARYLTYDPEVTETSCRDSGHIQRIAPHLLFRIPFLMPVPERQRKFLLFIEGFFEAYDRYQPFKRGKQHTRLTPDELREVEPGLTPGMAGAVTFDEWGIDGSRLCTSNALDAHERGAKLFIGCTVERIERGEGGAVTGVTWRNRHNGRSGRVTAPVVVNASGAWAPITASLSDLPAKKALVRPGKGIHIAFDRRLTNYAIMAGSIDGRQIFVEPWQNITVIGTTDDDYYGDLDDVVATSEEVRYLVDGIARVFPGVRQARMIGTWAGVRPTLYAYGPHEDKLSRDHEIIDHGAHGADGLYSMVGGKLASYRLFAESMVDIVARRFDVPKKCSTHLVALPGGEETVDGNVAFRGLATDPVAARRLLYRHGSRALRIAERIRKNPGEARTACVCEPVLEAEVRYVIRHEFASDVGDVSRRTRLGLGACGGMQCAARCGAIVAEERGLSPSEGMKQALAFIHRQARMRTCALNPEQARQEAIAIGALRAQLGILGKRSLVADLAPGLPAESVAAPPPPDSDERPARDEGEGDGARKAG